MQHYVCPGDCEGASENPGVCQSGGCSHEGKPLLECGCDDGLHHEILSPASGLDIETMDDEDAL